MLELVCRVIGLSGLTGLVVFAGVGIWLKTRSRRAEEE